MKTNCIRLVLKMTPLALTLASAELRAAELPGVTPRPGPDATREERRAWWRNYNPIKVVKGRTIRDGNNDGWDDMWLLVHQWAPGGGARTNVEGAPDADFDGDGVSNYDEMLQGTCPHPRLKRVELTPAQRAEFARKAAALRAEEEVEAAASLALREATRQQPLRHADGTPASRESLALDQDRGNEALIRQLAEDPAAEDAKVDAWMARQPELQDGKRPPRPSRIVDGRPRTVQATSIDDAASMTRTLQVRPNPNIVPQPAWTNAAPFNLTGSGTRCGHWDLSGALTSHNEFQLAAGGTKVRNETGVGASAHGTASIGVLVGKGVNANARGMAPEASADCYDWYGMQTEIANTRLPANAAFRCDVHTIGWAWQFGWEHDGTAWVWHGNGAVSATEDSRFGAYDNEVGTLDVVLWQNPGVVVVCGPANNSSSSVLSGGPAANTLANPLGHYEIGAFGYFYTTAYRPNDGQTATGGAWGYDTIGSFGAAKNAITVGAANLLPGGWTGPNSVTMKDYSGHGPTDCGRVKPDIVASGEVSPVPTNTGTGAYSGIGGTSSALVHAGGSIDLLVEHWKKLHTGQPVLSSAGFKALVIHTADEMGAEGPDFVTGWGLLNTEHAASVLSQDAAAGNHDCVKEGTIATSGTNSFTVVATGTGPVRITLCWNDVPGTIRNPNAVVDVPDEQLVNDLDLKVTGPGGTNFYPWLPDPANPAAQPTTGLNRRDNVEQIEIPNPIAGAAYTVTVQPFGNVINIQSQLSTQAYAMVLTGVANAVPPDLRVLDFVKTGAQSYDVVFPAVVGAVYRAEQSADLQTWTVLPGDFVASNPLVTAPVTSPSGAARQFYRIRRLF